MELEIEADFTNIQDLLCLRFIFRGLKLLFLTLILLILSISLISRIFIVNVLSKLVITGDSFYKLL